MSGMKTRGTMGVLIANVRSVLNSALATVVALLSSVWSHYFGPGYTVQESPLVNLSLWIPAAMLGVGVLLAGVFPFELTLLGAIFVFLAFTACHLVLWVLGAFYRNGILSSVWKALIFVGVLIGAVIVGGFLLFGWVIPAAFLFWFGSVYVPTALMPPFVIGVLALCFAWYAKGMGMIEGV